MNKVDFKTERCKGCALCAEFCPKKILKLSDKSNGKGYRYAEITDPAACVGCCSCAVICPDNVIEVN